MLMFFHIFFTHWIFFCISKNLNVLFVFNISYVVSSSVMQCVIHYTVVNLFPVSEPFFQMWRQRRLRNPNDISFPKPYFLLYWCSSSLTTEVSHVTGERTECLLTELSWEKLTSVSVQMQFDVCLLMGHFPFDSMYLFCTQYKYYTNLIWFKII